MAAARTRIGNVLLALVLITLLAIVLMLATGVRGGPLDPTGGPGSTPGVRLPGTPISVPTTISQPGYYYLTNDLTLTGGQTGVTITSPTGGVTLDMFGFAIRGDGTGTGVVVVGGGPFVDPPTAITIRNGTFRGMIHGVLANEATGVLIEDVRAEKMLGRGISIGSDSVVQDCFVTEAVEGVVIEGSNSTVRSCDLKSNSEWAMLVNGSDNLVEDVSFAHNALNGADFVMALIGTYHTIQRNTFKERDADVAEILVTGSSLNTINGNVGCPSFTVKDSNPGSSTYVGNPCLTVIP